MLLMAQSAGKKVKHIYVEYLCLVILFMRVCKHWHETRHFVVLVHTLEKVSFINIHTVNGRKQGLCVWADSVNQKRP